MHDSHGNLFKPATSPTAGSMTSIAVHNISSKRVTMSIVIVSRLSGRAV